MEKVDTIKFKISVTRYGWLYVMGVTIILYIAKYIAGITLLKDSWYNYLIAIDCVLFLLSIRRRNFKFKYVVITSLLIITLICYVKGEISRSDNSYYYLYSPSEKHRLVLKTYSKGWLTKDGYLEVYKSYFWVLKKRLCKTIIVPDTAPVMGPEPKYEKSPFVIGAIRTSKIYDSFFFLFDWVDEDTLIITYKQPDKLNEKYKEAKETIVKCN